MTMKRLTAIGTVVAMALGLAACGDSGDDPAESTSQSLEQAHQNSQQNMNDSGAGTTESTAPAGASTDNPQSGTMEEAPEGVPDTNNRSSTTTSSTAGGSVSEGESQAVPQDDVRANNGTSNTMSRAENIEQLNNTENNTGGASSSQQ